MGSSYSSEEESEDVEDVPKHETVKVIEEPIKAREDGDGMEKPPDVVKANISKEVIEPIKKETKETVSSLASLASMPSPILAATSPSARSSSERMIELPEAGLRMEKLPPIHDNVTMPPLIRTDSIIREKPKVYPRGSYPPTHKRNKEAKFVPYEPYKGAVAFMDSNKARKPVSPNKNLSKSLDSEVFENDKIDATICDKSREKSPEKTNCDNDEEEPREMNTELEKNYRVMLDIKEKELARMQEMLMNSEKQLKIQTKVNEEVKRLLVASVGEDIEARVEFLTQDKARLAADVLEYNNRIAIDWERKEELGVEKDVWRSKFLASTVIVDELTRTKQNVVQRVEDLEHLSRRLLLERTQLRQNLSSAQHMLDKLSLAFDPTSNRGVSREQVDCLQSSDLLCRSVETLSTRMLGSKVTPSEPIATVHVSSDTPAEAELKRLLARPLNSDVKVPDAASSVLAKNARPHLLKLGDMAATPRGHLQTFSHSHCSGTVHNV